jgi:hypothetical protein
VKAFFHNLTMLSMYMLVLISVCGCFSFAVAVLVAAFEPITFEIRWDNMEAVGNLAAAFVVSVVLLAAGITVIDHLESVSLKQRLNPGGDDNSDV